jgi:hypothetical protein
MTTIYQEQPRAVEGDGMGLVAGVLLVLAVIALVVLSTRFAPQAGNGGGIDVTPDNGGAVQFEGGGSVQGGAATGGEGAAQ